MSLHKAIDCLTNEFDWQEPGSLKESCQVRMRGGVLEDGKWILCPICKNKTRIKILEDTELMNFPLYCPKCKQETLINVRQLQLFVIKEPDA